MTRLNKLDYKRLCCLEYAYIIKKINDHKYWNSNFSYIVFFLGKRLGNYQKKCPSYLVGAYKFDISSNKIDYLLYTVSKLFLYIRRIGDSILYTDSK